MRAASRRDVHDARPENRLRARQRQNTLVEIVRIAAAHLEPRRSARSASIVGAAPAGLRRNGHRAKTGVFDAGHSRQARRRASRRGLSDRSPVGTSALRSGTSTSGKSARLEPSVPPQPDRSSATCSLGRSLRGANARVAIAAGDCRVRGDRRRPPWAGEQDRPTSGRARAFAHRARTSCRCRARRAPAGRRAAAWPS